MMNNFYGLSREDKRVKGDRMKRIDTEALKNAVSMQHLLAILGVDPGTNGRTRCPAHRGENPTSFSYTEDVWICFSCGKGGDKIDLIEEVLGTDTKGAIECLKDLTGLSAANKATIQPTTNLQKEIRQIERSFEGLERAWNKLLTMEWRFLKLQLESGEIDLSTFYLREQLIDEEFSELDEYVMGRMESIKSLRAALASRRGANG
jgi:hypothetical protein